MNDNLYSVFTSTCMSEFLFGEVVWWKYVFNGITNAVQTCIHAST